MERIPPRAWIIPIASALILIALRAHARADDAPIRLTIFLTCPEINALASWKGWPEIERMALAAGASPIAVDRARKCLASSNR